MTIPINPSEASSSHSISVNTNAKAKEKATHVFDKTIKAPLEAPISKENAHILKQCNFREWC